MSTAANTAQDFHDTKGTLLHGDIIVMADGIFNHPHRTDSVDKNVISFYVGEKGDIVPGTRTYQDREMFTFFGLHKVDYSPGNKMFIADYKGKEELGVSRSVATLKNLGITNQKALDALMKDVNSKPREERVAYLATKLNPPQQPDNKAKLAINN